MSIINIISHIMVVDTQVSTNDLSRWGVIGLSIAVAAIFSLLIPQLVSRYYYQQALDSLRNDERVQARTLLGNARAWLGPYAFSGDIKRIDIAEGDLSIRTAEFADNISDFFAEMDKAEKLFRAAVESEPLDIHGYTGLARATDSLERLYPFILKKPFPTKALPLYLQLIKLMPANIYSHTLLTEYFISRKMDDELIDIVSRFVRIYPQLYNQLKRRPVYSESMDEMLKSSLQGAVDDGVYVRQAMEALADLALKEEDYERAISYIIQARPEKLYRDTSSYDLRLGRLYTQAGNYAEAEHSFLAALKTLDKEQRLNAIWHHYKSKKLFAEFLGFCKKVDGKYLSELKEILAAECLMEMGSYELAISHLIRIRSGKYHAESLYLEGRIAKSRKDWDTMELRSQRATVIDPGNYKYHLLFSEALKLQKKYDQAELAASEAIKRSEKPNAWLYHHRAWIRWDKKDYASAKQDWEKAIKISPKQAWFYYGLALVYEKDANIDQAIRYIFKAVALKPDDERFRKKYNELKSKRHKSGIDNG